MDLLKYRFVVLASCCGLTFKISEILVKISGSLSKTESWPVANHSTCLLFKHLRKQRLCSKLGSAVLYETKLFSEMERSHKKLKGVLHVALSTSARNGDGVTFTHARISDAEIKVRTVM